MNFRQWQKEDNEFIATLEKQCFKTPWTLEMLDSSLKLQNFFGVVALSKNADELNASDEIVGYVGSIFDQWDAEILNVAVKSDFRRQGIGEKLMQNVIDFCQQNGKERVFLEVRKSNENAKALYQKLGFEAIGLRKNYYENTEDAIVMAKLLKGDN